jgi:ParB/RepB/Spo0J family partition protein
VFDPQRFNARWQMPTEPQIKRLADEIAHEGQKNPIAVWFVNEDGKKVPYVVEGFCRYLAIQYNKNNNDNDNNNLISFRVVPEKTELKNIILANIAENEVRYPLTPMDRAHGMKMLHDTYKLSQQEIAEKYNVSQATVSNYIRLLDLPDNAKQSIHDGTLSMLDGLMLLKVAPSKRDETINKINNDNISNNNTNTNNSSNSTKNTKRDIIREATGKKFKRGVKDFIDMVGIEESECAELEDSGKPGKIPFDYFKLFNQIARWFDGDVDTDRLLRFFQEHYSIRQKK